MVGMVDLATVRSKIWVDLLWLSHISGSSSRPFKDGSNIVFTTYSRYSHLSPTVSLYGCLLNNTHNHVSSDLVGILNHEQCWKVKYRAAEARASACWWYGTRNGILTVHCIVEYLLDILYCLKVAAPVFWKVMSWGSSGGKNQQAWKSTFPRNMSKFIQQRRVKFILCKGHISFRSFSTRVVKDHECAKVFHQAPYWVPYF